MKWKLQNEIPELCRFPLSEVLVSYPVEEQLQLEFIVSDIKGNCGLTS